MATGAGFSQVVLLPGLVGFFQVSVVDQFVVSGLTHWLGVWLAVGWSNWGNWSMGLSSSYSLGWACSTGRSLVISKSHETAHPMR